jgi:nitroreductase
MKNKSLDEIITYRRSIRVFKAESPPLEDIKKIIRAGLLAPYAAQAVGDAKDFRKFFIIKKDSKTLQKIAPLMKREAELKFEVLKNDIQKNPSLTKRASSFLKKLELVKNQGVLGVGTAPYYIIVAERKGFPPVEQQSLAHCLQNMWLKATELGLGFHLVSMTAEMIRNKEFCELLNIPDQEYGINGCAIGYPKDDHNPNPLMAADVNRFIEELS